MHRTTATTSTARACARALSAAIAAAALAGPPPPPAAEFHPLGDLAGGDFYSATIGISGDGATVIGWSKANSNAEGQYRAFRWREDIGITPLGHIGPDTINSIARGVSFDGSIIVGRSGDAFRWTDATGMQSIGACAALGLSGDGSIVVGYCATMKGNEAATWTQLDGWTTFGALGPNITDAFFFDSNFDGSAFSGQSFLVSPNVEPIRWTKKTGMVALGDVPGGLHYGLGFAISADGSTVVGDAIGDIGQDAFLWTQDTGLVNLEFAEPGVEDSHAQDVSGDGSIIVGATDVHGAMVWDAPHGMRSLQQLLSDVYGLELPGWTLLSAAAVSDNGRAIAGNGVNPDGNREAWLVRLPPRCAAGDLDGDDAVNVFDLFALLNAWGPCAGCPADFDGNNIVDVFDLFVLLDNWGACPIP